MIKRMLILLLCFCTLLLCACAANTGKPDAQDAPEQAENAPAADGDVIETDGFTVTAAKGWEKMDIPGGVQLYKGSLIYQVSVTGMNVTPEEDLAGLQSLKDQYGGEIEEVEMLGLTFYRLYYTAASVDQVFYSAVKDGEQIHIQIGGSGFADNADIAAMLDSLELK